MSGYRVIILGATGLIGSHLLKYLEADNSVAEITVLVRKNMPSRHPKTIIRVIDFNNLVEFKSAMDTGDFIFSCVGTTMKKVKGDKEAYRKVDYDIPIHAASWGIEKGYTKFLLVSSVGADSRSRTFYLRLKGEVEDDLVKLPYPVIHIFQPSMLYGERNETRTGESIGKGIMKAISGILPSRWSRFKGISGDEVAKAMLVASHLKENGRFYHTYESIKTLNQ